MSIEQESLRADKSTRALAPNEERHLGTRIAQFGEAENELARDRFAQVQCVHAHERDANMHAGAVADNLDSFSDVMV